MTDKSYHHGDLKSQLIQEGLKILDKEGYDGFTLRKVAKACQVSQTAPYRHYKNKDELIAAITLHALLAFNASLEKAVTLHPDDPARQLNEMGVAYIIFFRENPEYFRLLFLSDIKKKIHIADNGKELFKQSAPEQKGDPFVTLSDTVLRYKQAHPEEEMSQEELVLYCWGFVHGISALIASGFISGDAHTLSLVGKMLRGK